MKLLSLKLLHYRRFRQEEIVFQDDFSLVFGKNGAGKSSVLDAIGFALFWPGSKDFVRVNRDYLKSYFLTDREPSKVELIFQYGMDTYRLVRVIDAGIKKFASSFIVETKDTLIGPNGLELIGGDEITDYISSLLWINKETFLRSVFTKQKDLEVLSGTLSERKELINRVLGLDKIEHIIEELKHEERESKTLLEVYKKKMADFDIDVLKTQKDDISKRLLEISGRLWELILTQKNFLVSYDEIKKRYDEIEKLRNQFLMLQKKSELSSQSLKNIEETLDLKHKELLGIGEKEKEIDAKKWLLEAYEALKQELLSYQTVKTKFDQKCTLEKELENLNKEQKELEKKFDIKKVQEEKVRLTFLEQEFEKNEVELKKLISEIAEFQAQIKQIQTVGEQIKLELATIKTLGKDASCPTCKRPLEKDFPHLIALFEKDIEQKRAEYKKISTLVQEKLSEKWLLEEKMMAFKKENIFLQESQKESIRNEQLLQNILKNRQEKERNLELFTGIVYDQNRYQALQKNYQELTIQVNEYHQILGQIAKKQELEAFIEKKSQEKSLLQEETVLILKEIQSISYDENQYQLLKKEYNESHGKLLEINSHLSSVEKEKLSVQFELQTLEQKEKTHLDDKNQIDLLIEKISFFAMKKQIMADYIIYMLNHLKPRIEDLASQYFAIITEHKYTQISLDPDYNIMIDGKNIELYSGGEKDLAHLCFRLSLGQNLTSSKGNPINFLVLDEVLASQDKLRQENILLSLKKLESKFSQIILISHLDEIKEFATHLIEVRALNREESEIIYY